MLAVVVAGTGTDVRVSLAALAAQSRRPDAVVGVDVTGTGAHATTLRTHLDHVVTAHAVGLGDAVRAGVGAHDASRLAPAPDPHDAARPSAAGRPWLWVLAGGGVPAPDALARLLDAVEVAPSVAVAGCKHTDGDRLVDAGLTLSRLGRPLTGVEAGDVDQGQLDHREDVLAVGSDGMLIRRDAWDDLGGFDPALRGRAADVDLCRRAWRAGHRVTLAGRAVLSRPTAHGWDRRQLVHLRLVSAPLPLLPLVVLGVMAGAVARLGVRIAAKEPARGLAEVLAVAEVLLRPDRLWRSRRAATATAVRPRGDVTALLAGRREVAGWHRARWHARRTAASPAAPRRHRRWKPALIGVGVLAAFAAASLHRLVGPGEVTGAGLAAAPDTLGRLWFSATSSWGATGLGTPAPPDPFLAVLSGASLLSGGSPALAVVGLMLLAVPLAGLGAYLAAGEATGSLAVRAWAAVAWAAAPARTAS
ncbi:MAG TPA: glycosyltransferase, partial [Actinomycetales bacterium]|nr:glycosyltransferase [Actinomycetales bacterium]